MKFGFYKSIPKSIPLLLIFIVLLNILPLKPVYAFDKSRFFNFVLFFSGLGSSAASVVLQSQANQTYDKYLHTASQAEMEKFIEDYEKKHKQSIIASRAGIGIVIGSILISFIDAAHIPPSEEQTTQSIFGSIPGSFHKQRVNIKARDDEITMVLSQRF
ncbi:hypothetical protein FJZ33_10415 [Candidatus Poribacteria bacterium]|nr:hypothetical protein [Candidatus Poribacteria bacterium]